MVHLNSSQVFFTDLGELITIFQTVVVWAMSISMLYQVVGLTLGLDFPQSNVWYMD